MNRERALQIVLVLVGLFFTAGIYFIAMMLYHRDRTDQGATMMLSLYVTLGILLLLSVRNPAANRSLIAFAAWSSFAHATVMSIMALQSATDREGLWASALLVVIGAVLIALRPAKASAGRS